MTNKDTLRALEDIAREADNIRAILEAGRIDSGIGDASVVQYWATQLKHMRAHYQHVAGIPEYQPYRWR